MSRKNWFNPEAKIAHIGELEVYMYLHGKSNVKSKLELLLKNQPEILEVALMEDYTEIYVLFSQFGNALEIWGNRKTWKCEVELIFDFTDNASWLKPISDYYIVLFKIEYSIVEDDKKIFIRKFNDFSELYKFFPYCEVFINMENGKLTIVRNFPAFSISDIEYYKFEIHQYSIFEG